MIPSDTGTGAGTVVVEDGTGAAFSMQVDAVTGGSFETLTVVDE